MTEAQARATLEELGYRGGSTRGLPEPERTAIKAALMALAVAAAKAAARAAERSRLRKLAKRKTQPKNPRKPEAVKARTDRG